MKKPKTLFSKKAALFNILWILVENPTNLEYFRISDIMELLEKEFGIKLDYKTVLEYVNILMDLNLDIQIDRANNKGYYVKSRIVTNIEHNLLFNAVNEVKTIDNVTKERIYNLFTFDMSSRQKEILFDEQNRDNFFSSYYRNYNLPNTLKILEEAITQRRKIRFEYMTFDKKDEYKAKGIVYEMIPLEIRYLEGMYYLYTVDKMWPKAYCGIKIKYMKNIELLEPVKVVNDIVIDYRVELGVIYDWSIEFIDETFSNYQIVNINNMKTAIIYAPYQTIFEFCKRFSPFYVIYDEKLKEDMKNDFYDLLDSLEKKDEIILNIKSSIVNHHYNHPIDDNMTYDYFMSNLKHHIITNLKKYGYIQMDDGFFKGNHKILVEFVEFSMNDELLDGKSLNSKPDDFKKLELAINKLNKASANAKYIVVFYGNITNEEKKELAKLFKTNNLNYIHDQFSRHAKAYFYNYDVFKI